MIYKLTINRLMNAFKLLMLGLVPLVSVCAFPSLAADINAAQASDSAPIDSERLSDWILRQPQQSDSFPLGLQWRVPSQVQQQAKLKLELMSSSDYNGQGLNQGLKTFVYALPITGRVSLNQTDARWLQAHPSQDPVLKADHQLILPVRPTTVSVLMHNGALCTVPHSPGTQVRFYIQACLSAQADSLDRAWVVQPDGQVQNFGIGPWNQEAQSQPAPGALIWAPTSGFGISAQLAQFVATQTYEDVLKAGKASMQALQVADPMAKETNSASSRVVPAISNLPITSNDWGMTGLLQTPTARMPPAGDARFNTGRVYPYERINVFVQPFEGLEAGFRYTTVVNRLYGPADLSGSQPLKDKSIDFKLRLMEENSLLPQVALGMIDFGGTGLFSSEYVVANKRFGNLDASLGMAWGNLGARGNVPNPLARLSSSFDTRSALQGMGGTPAFKSFFRGPAALFGGVQYQSPWRNWVLKAEYDGNNYQHEPQANNRKQITPLNYGAVYRSSPSVDFSVGFERGNTLMIGLTLHTSLAQLSTPKVSDPPTPKVVVARPQVEPEWVGTAADSYDMSGWVVKKLSKQGSVLKVQIESLVGVHWNDRIERIVTLLHRDSPAYIDTFELTLADQGVPLTMRVVDRATWVKQHTELVPPAEVKQAVVALEPAALGPNSNAKPEETLWELKPAPYGYGLVPSWQQNIGGPDGFLLFRAGLSVPMQVRLASNVFITGNLSINLIDNYGKFKYTAPSNMPRVRTYLREYMTASKINLSSLQVTHFSNLSDNTYYSMYAGYLEGMYAGAGGEWMYRQWHSPYAFGVDLNRVQQRSFNQYFGVNHAGDQSGYRATTGHATAYWDTGWQNTTMKLSAGRYLAGDVGATLDMSRTFANGVAVGAWATKTNVSAQRFGEGSFDKGLYLRIPFDVMTTTRSGNVANLAYNPLTRDGGARLNREFTLYGATSPKSQKETGYVPAPMMGTGGQ